MTGASDERRFMPEVGDDLPDGIRPMIAIVRALPGHEEQLAAAVTTLAAAVRAEPGCVAFRAFHGLEDAGSFHLYEIYADAQAFRTHLATAHVAHFFTELARHSSSDAGALTQLVELS